MVQSRFVITGCTNCVFRFHLLNHYHCLDSLLSFISLSLYFSFKQAISVNLTHRHQLRWKLFRFRKKNLKKKQTCTKPTIFCLLILQQIFRHQTNTFVQFFVFRLCLRPHFKCKIIFNINNKRWIEMKFFEINWKLCS